MGSIQHERLHSTGSFQPKGSVNKTGKINKSEMAIIIRDSRSKDMLAPTVALAYWIRIQFILILKDPAEKWHCPEGYAPYQVREYCQKDVNNAWDNAEKY